MSFPASPSDGATTLVNGVTYVYSLANLSWSPVASINSLAVSALTVSGNDSITGSETVGGNLTISGNLGVGTLSPQRKLDIEQLSTDYQLRIGDSGGNYYDIGRNTTNGLLTFYGNQAVASGYKFSTVNGDRMVIDTNGNVGIGTTNPSNKLQVQTGGAGTDGIIVASSGGQFVHMRANNSSGANNALVSTGDQSITFGGNGIDTGSLCIVPWASSASGIKITASGNVGITNSPSGLARLEVKNSGAQNVAYFKNWSGTAASPTENADWPWPVLSLSAYGNFYLQRMLTFSLPNDGQSQGGGTYITDDSVWNISLNGVTSTGWDNNSNTTPVNVSSSNVGLQLMGPGNLRLGTQNAQAVVIRTSNTDRVTVNANGYVTMPYQPAFFANNPSTSNVTETNGYDFPFNSTVFNIGNCYNTSTYRFTAPVAGVYHFSYNLFNNGGTGRISFKLNGGSYNNTQNDCTTTTGPITQSQTIYLNVNDYVTVGDWQSISGKVIYMGHSSFSGFLVG